MWDFIKANYIRSAVQKDQYEDLILPQVAFVGRSNVGKSSLINSLCRQRSLAKTSSTPGKTRTVNFFSVNAKYAEDKLPRREFYIVDLPGYGFAKASKTDKAQWSKFIQAYVEGMESLQKVYQLIDIRHDLMKNDLECFEWLKSLGVSTKIIFTKADKIGKTKVAMQKASLCRALGIRAEDAIVYSAVSSLGRQELIEDIINNL